MVRRALTPYRRALVPVTAAAALAGLLVPAPPADAAPAAPSTAGQVVLLVHTRSAAPAGTLAAQAAPASTPLNVRHSFPALHVFSVAVPAAEAATVAARLRATPGVTGVESPVTRTYEGTAALPDDPAASDQQSRYLGAVHAAQAWASNTGSSKVTIAVIDSGVDVHHPDLRGKIAGTYNTLTGGSSVPDTNGHGTFVAGVAAADTGNGIGISGAGYDSDLLAVKISRSKPNAAVDQEIAGIRWATDHGADVINLSIGGPDPSRAERAAVEYAIRQGVLVVAAAGNGASSAKTYPAAYPGVVSVAATNLSTHRRAGFSSYGSWVTLAAPGVGIYSTVPVGGTAEFPSSTGYTTASGTSFSTPLVAGEAALMIAKNPGLGVGQLRSALVASAGGYAHQGLGAGQVDFATGLQHVAPTTAPSSVSVDGTTGDLTLHATTQADAVAFSVDGGPLQPVAAAPGGTATQTFPSWGYSDGTHTLHAVNCTAIGVCGDATTDTDFTVVNAPPTVTSPLPSQRVTGRFAVQASAPGGGVRLLVDGKPGPFAASAPYDFLVDGSALSDGLHAIQAQLCTADGTHCDGTSSTPVEVDVRALHPHIARLTPDPISPNADGVRDQARLTYRLPSAQDTTVVTLDASGHRVAAQHLGTQAAGRHTVVWTGRRPNGHALPDGTYTVAVSTARTTNGVTERGWVARTAVVDAHAPRIAAPTGRGTRFFPVHDGYEDTFNTRTSLSAPGHLSFIVSNAAGHVVRRLDQDDRAGAAHIVWDGRNAAGHVVPAGVYTWRLRVRDAAGNVRTTPAFHLVVSAKRLVTITRTLRRTGAGAAQAGGTDRHCTSASRKASSFTHGILLRNSCRPNGFDFSYARYGFTVPRARTYHRLVIDVDGRSSERPTELSASIQRTDGGVEVPRYVTVSRADRRTQRFHVVTLPAAGRIDGQRRVFVNFLVDSKYPGANDFDIRSAVLRVTFTALR